MKNFFYTLIITSSLFIACVEDKDIPCREQVVAKTFVFNDSQLAVIPYSKADTLVFYAGLGDSLYFLTQYYIDTATTQITNSPNNPDCPNDYESHQNIRSSLSDNSSFLTYSVKEQTQLCFFMTKFREEFSDWIEIPISAIGAKDSTFLDSVELGNQMFYNVNKFRGIAGATFYIHPSLGLLQFTSSSKIYTLQKFNSKSWK